MKILKLCSVISITLFLTACNDSNDKPKPTRDDGVASAFNEVRGTWIDPGTGSIWQFDQSNFTAYNFNSYGCVQIEHLPLANVEDALSYLEKNVQNTLIFNNKGTNPQIFNTIAELPISCLDENLLSNNDLVTNFEFFWHSMNDYYAFFEQRNVDWQAVYDQYRPQISNNLTELAFFEIIDDIIEEFGDGHLSLSNNSSLNANSGELNGFAIEVLRSSLVDTDEGYQNAWNELYSYNEQVVDSLLKEGDLQQHPISSAIRWGTLSEKVGYLRIDRLMQIAQLQPSDEPDNFLEILAMISEDLETIDPVMNDALTYLAGTDAMIIDLRFNQGGFDNIALKIASYFAREDKIIATKAIENNTYTQQPHSLSINAKSTGYHKPIYVITGNTTGSGAEVLTLALKSLEQSTIVGESTNGSVSDALYHQLPNGWQLTLSNEVYRDMSGNIIEGQGVSPDVEMPVYASQDVLHYSNTPIDFIMQELNEIDAITPDIEQVEQSFSQYFTPTNIPGIAISVISKGQVVYQKAMGLANIENQTPVTLDTPFNVGSISKAVLATAIMQQIEQGNISLNDSLDSMNLIFDPNNPLNQDEDNRITLRHLVTHTSGLRDSDGYGCSYYLHETGQSLYHLFGVEECPELVPTDLTEFFTSEYFTPNGRYVMNGVHLPGELGVPEQIHQYTNIGAALAAYAIEQKLGINLAERMQSKIFAPLAMINSQWDHTQLSPTNAKATQYTLDDELTPLAVPEYSYPTFYDGDLNTSANDLTRFLLTIMNGGEYQGVQILNQESVETMLTSQTEVLNENDKQGVFWYWQGPYVGHNGGDPGTYAIMQYNKSTESGIVILMNGEDGYLGENQVDELIIPLMSTLYRYGLRAAH